MPFSTSQIKALNGKLPEKYVRLREHRGTMLSYIEGWHAISEANRIFGYDGWDRETISSECVWQDVRREPKACAYAVRVRIHVRAGDTAVLRDGSGVGYGTGATAGEAHEAALKEAETDATKRALTTFGNLFGLALYDKRQKGVRRLRRTSHQNSPPAEWVLVSAKGDLLRRHKSPHDFCTDIRQVLKDLNSNDELDAFWQQNTEAIARLLTTDPNLRTSRGTHYADVLQHLYNQRKAQLNGGSADTPCLADVDQTAIDKSALLLAAPKRIRDPEHLTFIASLPCLICARTPSQAHHLRFVQPRALSSKPSDEWAVPLCALHHRALHDAGSEEKWWSDLAIDARTEAGRLWRDKHRPTTLENTSAGPAAE